MVYLSDITSDWKKSKLKSIFLSKSKFLEWKGVWSILSRFFIYSLNTGRCYLNNKIVLFFRTLFAVPTRPLSQAQSKKKQKKITPAKLTLKFYPDSSYLLNVFKRSLAKKYKENNFWSIIRNIFRNFDRNLIFLWKCKTRKAHFRVCYSVTTESHFMIILKLV